MGIFRRSMSSSSAQSSRPSTINSSASDTASSRTSMDSTLEEHDVADSMATIKQLPTPARKTPILSLPLELIQQVNTYLDTSSAAAFCLSSRYVYYALGTEVLSRHVEGSRNRFEKRKTIEAVVERAFPGHWFCAWCDRFHAWSAEDGPKSQHSGGKRDCADFNSYLDAGNGYKLRYHHVRLAINRASWGDEHGIPLSAFTYEKKEMARISRTPVPTKLSLSARIVQGHFLLHSSYAIILPAFTTRNRNLLKSLWPLLPHIVTGHRDTPNGHTGLMAAIDNVIRRGWKYQFTQNCSTCATDWSVTTQDFSHATGGQVRLVVQSWRDLGTGRTPFETGWRSHGVGSGDDSGANTCLVRLTSLPAGSVRRAFEAACIDHVSDEADVADVAAKNTSKSRIYRSFMKRTMSEEDDSAIRRSSARPRYWRTREENEEVARKYEEDRRDVARNVAEELVRLDAQRGRGLV
ncbi:hypothetical protein AA0113_g12449 [Alternaria arborescens]|uniref:F-box domain-containing protein n=1 Tax=Alternaria arborescens TaxID=156630 RepID=A0A4Q4PWW5_9PLEO|nr:hypothetical protein AA0111_g10760 [Alternaria arborescens]RYN43150.1 hypothetical protein AA0112_g1134 [Alternaria arborescens]RYO18524.1 hypothetical protein AA0111_g10760 [Alternaria arborescens]RYO26680.1 hypothetical protein AA0113_g12449 [Alternaria arborescens]